MAAAALAAAAMGWTGACANQAAPPGGPEDRRPPIVIRTEPDTFGDLPERNGHVRFDFNERISESVAGGDLSSAVTVSPLTGEVHVSHGRSSIDVSLEGGFRPGLVYRVTLLPVVSDLFGNTMRDAFELVFSTGGSLAPTATLAGEVWDRLTGRGVNAAAVLVIGADSLVNVARADNDGVFALRYLPLGDFTVTAFQDNDRNGELGPREPRGSTSVSIAEGDTLLIDVPVLAPDTTPAVPAGVSALDSVTIVVQFDDYLDPDASLADTRVELTREDGVGAPVVTRLFHEAEYANYVDQVADSFARLDSIAAAERAAAGPADSAGAAAPDSTVTARDSTGAAADSVAAVSAPPEEASARPIPPRLDRAASARDARPGRTPPGQRLVGLLDPPLQEGEYQVRVSGVVNVNGVVGGGGDVTLAYAPPPPPADSTSAAGDTGDIPAADAPAGPGPAPAGSASTPPATDAPDSVPAGPNP